MGYLRGLDHLWVLVSAKGSTVPKMQETSYSHHYSHLHTKKELKCQSSFQRHVIASYSQS